MGYDHIVRLDEIAEVTAFLSGARIPLVHTFRSYEGEWIVSILMARLPGEKYLSVFASDERFLMQFAIDCSHPDVVRWVDGKIGALTYASSNGWTLRIARRVCREEQGGWSMKRTGVAAQFPVWNRQGRAYRNTSGHDRLFRLDCPALAAVPCDHEHLPTARAALVRALFGKESPCPN